MGKSEAATIQGKVWLVGAGPGDPGLLTLAGKEALEKAEVVLYDRLVGETLLGFAPNTALLVDVGKESGRHPVPQEEINRLLLEYAGQRKQVVRLKGGDPYLFGRGAEELEGLRRAGIPFRVVPGVTSAIAVPAYGGIPLTHREHSSSVHILTGHGRDRGQRPIPYRQLASMGGTIVFLMGVAALPDVCTGLLEGGMPPGTPAALMENGTTPAQRKLISTLEKLPEQAREWAAKPPAVLVVGDVCTLAEDCGFTMHLPLWGKRILVAATAETGGRLEKLLREQGCAAESFPCIRTVPMPQSSGFWKGVNQYQWIALTSPVGANLFFDGLQKAQVDIRNLGGVHFAAVGPKTAEAAQRRGVLIDLVPEVYDGSHLALALAGRMKRGESVLLFRSREGMEELPALLTRSGIVFEDIAAYTTQVAGVSLPTWEKVDGAAFTSASAVRGFALAAGETAKEQVALCIGESTAQAARALGMKVFVSCQATLEGMVSLAVEVLGRRI